LGDEGAYGVAPSFVPTNRDTFSRRSRRRLRLFFEFPGFFNTSLSQPIRGFLLTCAGLNGKFENFRNYMRVVIQRAKSASVRVEGRTVGAIGIGMVVLLGATKGDTEGSVRKIAEKLMHLRIFEDGQGKMNLSAKSVGAEFLVISQFTLYADTSRGRRPSFTDALEAAEAERLYLKLAEYLRESGFKAETGLFGAKMQVELVNDGPATFIIEEK